MSTFEDSLDDVILTEENQVVVDENDYLQLIVWSKSDEEIECQYGKVTMEDYCNLEQQRIEKGGWRQCAVLKQDGLVSLWVDDPLMAEIRKRKQLREEVNT